MKIQKCLIIGTWLGLWMKELTNIIVQESKMEMECLCLKKENGKLMKNKSKKKTRA